MKQSNNLQALVKMLADGSFHHATYRNVGTLWEGLWIYQRSETGFRGFESAIAFLKNDPELPQAEELTRGTGISVGVYGQG
jgi:hypothetical protein